VLFHPTPVTWVLCDFIRTKKGLWSCVVFFVLQLFWQSQKLCATVCCLSVLSALISLARYLSKFLGKFLGLKFLHHLDSGKFTFLIFFWNYSNL
jgi:hypothetical protein